MLSSDLKYYEETIILAELLNTELTKTADISSMVSGLVSAVKNYVSDKIDPNNKLESVFNILAPGMLGALGFPMLSGILWLAEEFFDVKPGEILGDIVRGLENSLKGGTQVTPAQVDVAANQAVLQHYGGQPTEETLQKFQSFTSRDAQIYKVALLHILAKKEQLEKNGISVISPLLRLIGIKANTASILARVLGWIVKTVLISAGFMAGGALVEHFMGKPSSPVSFTSSSPSPMIESNSTQQVFKVNPSYNEEDLNVSSGWIEGVPPAQIGGQLLAWAEDIYPDLRGKEELIQNAASFQAVVRYIQKYNANNITNITFIPKQFTSRKKVVDLFIDELANKSKEQKPDVTVKSIPVKETMAEFSSFIIKNAKKPIVNKFEDGIVICGEFGSPEVEKILTEHTKNEGKLNLIVSDPPYGSIVANDWDKGIKSEDYIRWTKDCLKYLTKGGSLYMWGGIGKPRQRIFFDYLANVEDKTGMTMRNLITWSKRRAYGKSDDYLFCREECAWLINGEKPKIFHVPLLETVRPYDGFNKDYPAKSKFYRRTNIWSVPELFSGKVHIAQKPEKLASIMIETHTNKGNWVLDPFSGSGSTALAARKLGRKFIMIERDPENFKLICSRLDEKVKEETKPKTANVEILELWTTVSILDPKEDIITYQCKLAQDSNNLVY